ncbi:MAG: hypothetical protein LEGION0403_FIIPPAGN_02128 [Legionella sp.]|uniref:hypothetical protein n=1 Tax=Legionella sp. TaxID=459 RepID=UPI003D0CAAE0
MNEKLKLIYSAPEKETSVFLHSDIGDILFEYRRYIKNVFLQIKGHYEIAYFGINIISPSNELVSFSSMPHIEYNLIQQGFWKYDPHFSSRFLNKNTLFWWDDIKTPFAEDIRQIKLINNHFSAGMTLSREINQFNLLYSYATNSKKKNLKEYYDSQIFGLIDIGDYFFKAILKLYSECYGKTPLPQLNQLNSKAVDLGIRSTLQLIVNNS